MQGGAARRKAVDSDESGEDWNPKAKGSKKAPRAPAAPAPPPMTSAVPIKPLPPKPVTTRAPKAVAADTAAEPEPSELSLGARLAGRMADLQLDGVLPLATAPKAAKTAKAAAPKAAPRPRKAAKPVVLSERYRGL